MKKRNLRQTGSAFLITALILTMAPAPMPTHAFSAMGGGGKNWGRNCIAI